MGLSSDPEVSGRILKWRDVTVHFDSPTSHTAGETVKSLKANKIKFIPAEKWTPNSPEVSPMDFFGNGYLISLIKKRHIRGLDSLRERSLAKYSPRNVSKSFILVV